MTPSPTDHCHPLTDATGPLSSSHTRVFQALGPLCPPRPAAWTDAVPSASSTIPPGSPGLLVSGVKSQLLGERL